MSVKVTYKATGREEDTLVAPEAVGEAEPSIAVSFSGNFCLITKDDGVTSTVDVIPLESIKTVVFPTPVEEI